jgi:hypothetical protein
MSRKSAGRPQQMQGFKTHHVPSSCKEWVETDCPCLNTGGFQEGRNILLGEKGEDENEWGF